MTLKNWLIRRLGGIVPEDLPKEVLERLADILPEKTSGERIEFLPDVDAQGEQDALDEINKPAWKKFLDQFRIK